MSTPIDLSVSPSPSSSSPSSSSSSSASPSTSVVLHVHPLVVLSISDHLTRSLHQYNSPYIFGLVFGHQDGRSVDMLETVEMTVQVNSSSLSTWDLHVESLEKDMKLFQTCYPSYECLGWYRSGSGSGNYQNISEEDRERDINMHHLVAKWNEKPLFILLEYPTAPQSSPSSSSNTNKDLPLSVYEERLHVVNDKLQSDFLRLKYVIDSDEAERILVVHCAQLGENNSRGKSTHHNSNQQKESSLISHYLLISTVLHLLIQ